MKGGMTDVRFCGTAFCIVDLMGDIEAPDRETERRAQEKQKEITFQNGVDGNICSYFFQHVRNRNMTYIYKRRFSKWLIWYGSGFGFCCKKESTYEEVKMLPSML